MSTTLVLVRHGDTDWLKQNRLAGRTPGIPLNDAGRAQARRLSARLAGWPLAAVYASPLERCHETAALLARPHRLPVIAHDGLLEGDLGEWQGQPIDTLSKLDAWRTVQIAPSFAQFPGGETMRAMQRRAVEALHEMAAAHPDQIIVACSHADVIKAALADFLGLHFDLFQRIQISPCSVSIVQFTALTPRILRINDTGDLNPPPAPQQAQDSGSLSAAVSENPTDATPH